MAYTQKKYVPGHFVGHGQFRKYERPHWAMLGGAWAQGKPPLATGGFTQMRPPQPRPPILGPGGNRMGAAQQGGILGGLGQGQPYIPMGQPHMGPGGAPMPMPGQQVPQPQDPRTTPFQPGNPTLVDMRRQLATMNLVQMLARLGNHAITHAGIGDGMRT